MSKLLEILGIAPIEESEEIKAVKNTKAAGAEKVAEKTAEDDAKMVDAVEQLEEKGRKSFIGELKDRGEKARQELSLETDRADFDAAVEEMANTDTVDDSIDDTDDILEEMANTDTVDDSIDDTDDTPADNPTEEPTSKPVEEPNEETREDVIEEVKHAIERRADSVIDILKNSRPAILEEENQMEERNFYDEIGDMVYEYDRTGVMVVRLEDYIKRIAAKDKNLCFQFINNYFLEYIENNGELIPVFFDNYIEDMLRKNPDWIPKLDKVITAVANDTMNIKVGFIRRIQPNDVVYNTLSEAKADIPDGLHEMARELVLNEDTFFDKIWQEVSRDGEEIRRLTRKEVEQYVADFRGDKDVLIRVLQLDDGEMNNANNPSDSNESEG